MPHTKHSTNNINKYTTSKYNKKTSASRAKVLCQYALYISAAFILSYIESLFPFSLGIPGVKLGLANIVVVVALYSCEKPSAIFPIMLFRTILVTFTFGNLSTHIFSTGGGLLSTTAMFLLHKTNLFSIYGISISGAIFHNIGQLIIAGFILETAELIYYMPVLLISGMLAGFGIGFIADQCLRRLKIFNNNN